MKKMLRVVRTIKDLICGTAVVLGYCWMSEPGRQALKRSVVLTAEEMDRRGRP